MTNSVIFKIHLPALRISTGMSFLHFGNFYLLFCIHFIQNLKQRTPYPTLRGSFSCGLPNTPFVHPTLGKYPTSGGSTVVD